MSTIEFFHDSVCGWCYLLSPRLRRVVNKYPVTVIHRTFVLQKSRQEMVTRFGSMARAKQEIMTHWQRCAEFAEDPTRFNIQGLAATKFEYPHGLYAALVCKAVELALGQQAHWDIFDAIQLAHLKHNLNIADINVLMGIVKGQGLDSDAIFELISQPTIREQVDVDIHRAKEFGLQTIPSLLINGRRLISQTLTEEQLCAVIEQSIAEQKS